MIADQHHYYVAHSGESDPGHLRTLVDTLPDDPAGLIAAVTFIDR